MDCGTIQDALVRRLPQLASSEMSTFDKGSNGLSSNTTITLVVTNEKLEVRELQRLAIQVHSSMARAIQPYSTIDDGDVLFGVAATDIDAGERLPLVDYRRVPAHWTKAAPGDRGERVERLAGPHRRDRSVAGIPTSAEVWALRS